MLINIIINHLQANKQLRCSVTAWRSGNVLIGLDQASYFTLDAVSNSMGNRR